MQSRFPVGRQMAKYLLVSSALGLVLSVSPAYADDSDAKLNTLERQITALQSELRHIKADMAHHSEQLKTIQMQSATQVHNAVQSMPAIPLGYALVPAGPGAIPGSVVLAQVEAPQEAELPMGTFRVGKVTVTLGGYIEAAGIYRTRNEVADISSNYNTGIPLNNSPNAHQSETRLTERQSKFSVDIEAHPDAQTKLVAYGEADFQGAASTSNSTESDSYVPRVRHLFAAYDRSDLGLYFLGGQTWSLLTMDKAGISYMPSTINAPITIDGQYTTGFSWSRQPQIRVVKTFDNGLFSMGGSLETPQVNYYTGPNGLVPSTVGTVNINNPGGSGYASTVNYSTDVAPDVIGKVAFDPGFAHFEAYGLLRVLHDRVSVPGNGDNKDVTAGGGGAAMLVHLIPKYLDLQGSFLIGDGIGRYGSSQLPDATVGANGAPVAIPEIQALVGLVGHPVPQMDLYGYFGTEEEKGKYFSADVKGKELGYGYGSPLYSNTTCDVELGSSSGCVANTSAVTSGQVGAWWRFMHNEYGTMQVGASNNYLRRVIFQGVGPTPKPNEDIVMLSFRYYPFQ